MAGLKPPAPQAISDLAEPCQCHDSFAMVTPAHPGHCCFVPETQTCHLAEVAEWERQNARRWGRSEANTQEESR